ncbi:TPA: sulfurtransferase complex subunit TusB [Pasteurella multocida]|nr:sulfurtransferase complex subunit TusB [Pasteurella multocida]
MLYTFSQSNYTTHELIQHLQNTTAQDAIVLWQDGVYLLVKYPTILESANAPCYALAIDLEARNLMAMFNKQDKIKQISLSELVKLTEQHTPQFAL